MNINKLKGLIGIGIMATALLAMFVWFKFGQPFYVSEYVLVATSNLEKGSVINNPESDFIAIKTDVKAIMEGALRIEDRESLKGKALKRKVNKGGQISKDDIDNSNIVLKEGEFVFKVPTTWIYTIPSSIRRSDEAMFYEINSEIESTLNTMNASEYNGDANGTASSLKSIVEGKGKPVLNVTVAYVKDSANREVVDTSKAERLDGSAQVATIEIIANEAAVKTLEDSIKAGYKFFVVYK